MSCRCIQPSGTINGVLISEYSSTSSLASTVACHDDTGYFNCIMTRPAGSGRKTAGAIEPEYLLRSKALDLDLDLGMDLDLDLDLGLDTGGIYAGTCKSHIRDLEVHVRSTADGLARRNISDQRLSRRRVPIRCERQAPPRHWVDGSQGAR